MNPAQTLRLHQLEGFFHVATHEGYARAVMALPYAITEPALHQQVRKLERALGGNRLLTRGPGRRMLMTPAGRELYAFAAPYFRELPGVVRGIQAGAGTLVVASDPLFLEPLCAPVAALLRHDVPGLGLRLDAEGGDLAARIRSGDCDLAVSAFEGETPPDLSRRPLGVLGLQLVVPTGHELARRRPPLLPRHLTGVKLAIYTAGTPGRRLTDAGLIAAGIEVEVACEASNAAALFALAAAGVAPAFVPMLRGSRRPPRRRKLPTGGVAFDVSDLFQQVAGLPPFGLTYRTPSAALEHFAAAALRVLR
ncbi:MAG: LysR family transcriptional regulator [Planctomycetes bacterium]|nr:LysR family transcriptional regulator [Planctomycetota bacterium]